MGITKSTIALIVTGVLAAVSTTCCIISSVNEKKVRKELEKTRQAVANGINVDIPKTVLDDAISSATVKAVMEGVEDVMDDISKSYKADLTCKVKMAVDEEYREIRSDVKKEITKKIGKLNFADIREELKDEAREAAMEKFKDDMEDILKTYQHNLNNISELYKSMAECMKPESSNGGGIKISW